MEEARLATAMAVDKWERLVSAAPRMLELLQEIATEGYFAELIAHKVVSGLRYREEEICYGKLQRLLAEIDGAG
jgi:hypothetical protein